MPDDSAAAVEAASESIYLARAVFAGAAAYGHDPIALARRFDITPELLADPDARLPAPVAIRVWEEVPRVVGDEYFGVHLAERAPVGALPVVGYLVKSSATLGEGMARALRYQRLLQNLNRTEAEIGPTHLRLYHPLRQINPDRLRHAMDFAFGFVTTLARAVTGVHVTPTRVRFAHSGHPDPSPYRNLFGDEVSFGGALTEVWFDNATLTLPIATADPNLGEILERHAAAQLARVPDATALTARVRTAILERLRVGAPGLDEIADALHMASRTLQRRLKDEGTSLAALVEEVRRDLAVRYVEDRSLALAEVALLLGFSDQSTFHRAFVRWTGSSPGAYRRAQAP